MNRVMLPNDSLELKDGEKIDELDGSMSKDPDDRRMMRSVLENDKQTIDDGKLVSEMVNHSVGFTPDIAFSNLVKDYKLAEQIYGESFLRQITGYDARFLKKNLPLPEFRRDLKERIIERYDQLKKKKLVDKEGQVTEQGIKLGGLVLYMQELENLTAKGYGKKAQKKDEIYGEEVDIKTYARDDHYRDISVRKSIKSALRRQHVSITRDDMRTIIRNKKGKINIIYALDCSGSMKGKKLEMAKKAGIALMHRALSNKDKVGLVLFKSDVTEKIRPSEDFMHLLSKIAHAKAANETNLTQAVNDAISLFPPRHVTKHLIVLTDALPTVGEKPEKETLEAVSVAANANITLSVIGLDLDKKGTEFAKKIAELGKGRLYIARDLDNLDRFVLEDYSEI